MQTQLSHTDVERQWVDTVYNENTDKYACAVQQLYIYGGLLVINATINSAPLKVVVRIAKVGAAWHVIGETLMFS